MTVYFCYEENAHDLAIEYGTFSSTVLFDSAEKALVWFQERVLAGKIEGFVLDAENENVSANECNYDAVKNELERGFVSLLMFLGHQNNWDESYSICVERKEVY